MSVEDEDNSGMERKFMASIVQTVMGAQYKGVYEFDSAYPKVVVVSSGKS